jgi:hypothetical protein
MDLPYASGGGDSIVNGNYSVSVGADGVVTMETSRGSLEFGALPEPGGPSHFHIMRASGDNADLYFGDDYNYMLQRGPAYGGFNPTYGVEIGTNDNDSGSQHVWRFETDGMTSFPEIAGTKTLWGAVDDDFYIKTTRTDPGNDADIEISAADDLRLYAEGDQLELYANTSVEINANYNGSSKTWTFGTDGSLTLPQGSTIDEATEIVTVTLDQFTDGGYPGTQVFTKVSNTRYELSPGGPYMELVSSIWRLKISVSTYYSSTDLVTWETVAGAAPTPVGTLGTLVTMSLTANSNSWAFNGNGNLTFPDTTAQTTAFNIAKFGEGFSLNGADKIVTNKLYSTNASSPTQHYRLELDTNGVVVLPDQSIINGSTIRGIYGTGELNYTGITIGPDTNHREESWMYVDHTGSYIATQYNTNQKLWQFKNDGSTILPSGAGFVKGDNGQLKVNDGVTLALDFRDTSGRGFYTNGDGFSLRGNGSNTWLFGTDGSLTFPDTTTQSTAYKRTTGSWTVDTGSGSYSFTVPLNGTYSMWVKGNIPDGIIVWNATATVTNSNVPVVGQQYAWNYTGSGTPIEITAMPTQFIGTGNVIVSSNPSVGTSSNVFNFTINNTSGSAKTVYWGYVTQ